LKVRDAKSTAVVHLTNLNIVSLGMKEIIKKEKNHGFKRQNYYYNNRKKEFF
jgi:hypothetical protein